MKGENLYGSGQKVLSEQGRKNWDDIRWDRDKDKRSGKGAEKRS